jgi:DNA-binding PadR family transcriptional regulator
MDVLGRETAVLLALGQGPASGVEIMARLRESVAGAPTLGPGTLYPLLRRLDEAGLVRSWAEDNRSRVGRPRRFHELTPAGVATLERMRQQIRRLGSTTRDEEDAAAIRTMRSNLLRGFRVSAFAAQLQKAGGHA